MRLVVLKEGTRFGRLVVTGFAGTRDGQGYHHCVCDCGTSCVRRTSCLTRHRATHCNTGPCHFMWRGGKQVPGSDAWATNRLNCVRSSARNKREPLPYEGKERVIELWRKADGGCQCCGRKTSKLQLDHCHETGRLRGFLCQNCNSAIGFVSESPDLLRSIAKYVAQECSQLRIALKA